MEPRVEYQSEWLQAYIEGDIAAFTFSGNYAEISTDLEMKDEFFRLLSMVEANPEIKTLLVLNAPGALSDKAYDDFLCTLARKAEINEADVFLSREELALDQFILHINARKKITIVSLQGQVATPFFGAALAYDFRIGAPDLVFDLSHVRKGVPPSGGVGFYLPRYIGQARATDFMLSGRSIPARLARQLGLVNALLPGGDFVKESIAMARKLSAVPVASLAYTKDLIHAHSDQELEQYLRKEYAVMCRIRPHQIFDPVCG